MTAIIPAYNGEAFIAMAIESALDQSGIPLDVIVVDDCSSDRTADIARSYAGVTVIAMSKRGGNSYTSANVGLAHAHTEYVAFLHQDDLWQPTKLARQVALMDADPGIGLSYSALAFIDDDGRTLARLHSPVGRCGHVVEGHAELRYLCIQNYINVSNAVLRRRALEEIGGFPEDLWFAGEWATWLRMATEWRIGYVNEVLASFRVHGDSQTQSRTRDVAAFRNELNSVLDDLFAMPGLPVAVRRRRRLARANVELSTMLLAVYRSNRLAALTALSRLMLLTRPWDAPSLVHASAVIPRTTARLRATRGAAARHRATAQRHKRREPAPSATVGSPR